MAPPPADPAKGKAPEKSSLHDSPNKPVKKDDIKLPLYVWVLGAGVLGYFTYRVYKARKAAASTTTSSTTAATGTTTQTGCVAEDGITPIACPSYVPTPVATPTGNTPVQQQEYQNLAGQLNVLSGQASQTQSTVNGIGTQTAAPLETVVPGTQALIPYLLQGVQLSQAATKLGVPAQAIITANPGTSASTTGQVIQVPYQVTDNDSLASVAAKFGISVPHLQLVLATGQPQGTIYNNGALPAQQQGSAA